MPSYPNSFKLGFSWSFFCRQWLLGESIYVPWVQRELPDIKAPIERTFHCIKKKYQQRCERVRNVNRQRKQQFVECHWYSFRKKKVLGINRLRHTFTIERKKGISATVEGFAMSFNNGNNHSSDVADIPFLEGSRDHSSPAYLHERYPKLS
jgi:hypothetical protein